jgi:hypothetical protein
MREIVEREQVESLTERLSALETVIERGQQTFIEVGMALAEIRESRLYRETYATFEDYCLDRWGWSASRSRRLISSAEAVAAMQSVPIGTVAPVQNEGQARELAKIKDPETRAQVWRQVNEVAAEVETVITAKLVGEAVAVQKQIELKESGNGAALPQGFPTVREFQAEIKNSPGAKWNDTLYNILVTTNSIRDNGGISHLSNKWSLEQKQGYLDKINRLQATLEKIADEIQESINYAQN